MGIRIFKAARPAFLLGVMDGGALEARIRRLIDARLPWARRWRVVSAAVCLVVMATASVGVAMLGVRASSAQGAEVKLPEFEVASIKPSDITKPGGVVGLFTYPGGRIMCSLCPLDYLMMEAYGVEAYQVAGIPDAMKRARFDIEAKPPVGSAAAKANPSSEKMPMNEEQRLMLQALLRDRFQLKMHREDREGPIYVLEKNGKALQLRKSTEEKDKVFPWAGSPEGGGPIDSGLKGTSISMAQLAVRVSSWVRKPVRDETGLQGAYDFEYKIPEMERGDDRLAMITHSLQEIGLKLSPAKAPVETLVVDSVAQPSGN